MNRIPPIYWLVGLGATIVGFLWLRGKSSAGASPGTAKGQPQFTQAQEVQDFQIFSALTGAQQASDLNMVSTLAGLFSGGSSTGLGGAGAGGGGGTSPPSTGGVSPATAAYSQDVAQQLQFQSQSKQAQLAQLANSPDKSALQTLGAALAATPASQRGAAENFLLENEANQQSGYDYYNAGGLVTTPLGQGL